jgi:hypothetical protein
MKTARLYSWLLIGLMAAGRLSAQESGRIEQLQRQLKQLEADWARQQARQQEQIEALKKQIETLQAAPPAQPAGPVATPEPAPPRSLAAALTLAGGPKSYLNLSLDGLFAGGVSTAGDIDALQLGGHDPKQRGFTVQNVEAVFEGAVDPFFRGQANVVFQIDSGGETRTELEEAYLTTVALPGNLQLKAGEFYTEFGRLNPMHPHTWAFVDQPLVNGRFFGADGLRNPGARLSWLLPTPFYSELFLAAQNSQGETTHSFRSDQGGRPLFGRPVRAGTMHSVGDLLFAPRYAMSLDLTDTQTLLWGASAAFGPNGAGEGTDTQIYGVDWFWKWKSATHHGGFPFVSWQTEAMARRYQAAEFTGPPEPGNPTGFLPTETLRDYGMYSQVAWGFRLGWVAGLRGDYVSGERGAFYPDPDRDTRWRVSPNLTWYPSEYSKVRLQYNYDVRRNVGVDHSVWLQFEFLLGAHGAHKF